MSPGFEVGYLDVNGHERRGHLTAVANVAFEQVVQVRTFPTFHGQRNNTGLWWWATTGTHVGYESWLERDHVTLLDFDPAVVGVASQPFRLLWQDNAGRRRSHTPDFFARRADGTALVLDVRPEHRVRARDAVAFEATRQACDLLGWEYRLVHEPQPVRMANVRWLAGYRYPRCLRPDVAAAAPTVFAGGMPLMTGAERLGDPLATLPTVFHLLWSGRLTVDLTLPLAETSLILAAQR